MDLVQNKKQADIINYRPDLKMDNVPSLNPTFGDNYNPSQTLVNPPTQDRSLGLTIFEENMPSTIISKLENLIKNANYYKANLVAQMEKTDMGAKYLSAKEDEAKERIAKENEESIVGTTYLESYLQVESIRRELLGIKKVYSEATYGDDISSDMAREMDSIDIGAIASLELSEQSENVNYTSLYYETMVSSIMNRYCFTMEDMTLPEVGNFTEFSKKSPNDDKLIKLLSNNFQKKQEILQKDIFKDKKTNYNVSVALRNSFLAIQDYEDNLEALDSSLKELDDDVLALELQRGLLTDLSESMEDLLSVTTYSTLAKQDIANSLASKSKIREYFVE